MLGECRRGVRSERGGDGIDSANCWCVRRPSDKHPGRCRAECCVWQSSAGCCGREVPGDAAPSRRPGRRTLAQAGVASDRGHIRIKGRENEAYLVKFLDRPRVTVLGCDEDTAIRYAELKLQLKKQGTPIPINDVWIAALVLQHQATLLKLVPSAVMHPALDLLGCVLTSSISIRTAT